MRKPPDTLERITSGTITNGKSTQYPSDAVAEMLTLRGKIVARELSDCKKFKAVLEEFTHAVLLEKLSDS